MILPCNDRHITFVHVAKDGLPLGRAAARALGLVTTRTPVNCGVFLNADAYDLAKLKLDIKLRNTHTDKHRDRIGLWMQQYPHGEEYVRITHNQPVGWVVDGSHDKLTVHCSCTFEAVITPDDRAQGSRLHVATMYPVIDDTPTPKGAQLRMVKELMDTREWKSVCLSNPNRACTLLNRTLPTTPPLVYADDVIRYPIDEHHQLELDGNRLADRIDGVRYPFDGNLTATPWNQPSVAKAVSRITPVRTIFLQILNQRPAEDIRREKREQRAAAQVAPVTTAAQPARIPNKFPNESGIDQ